MNLTFEEEKSNIWLEIEAFLHFLLKLAIAGDGLLSKTVGRGFEAFFPCQISCLICLPDKSGNFLAFGAKTRKNTVKSEKTGFGMVITARPRPVFCVFRPKIPCTFYFKLTEQSSRKKLAAGGFEPTTSGL